MVLLQCLSSFTYTTSFNYQVTQTVQVFITSQETSSYRVNTTYLNSLPVRVRSNFLIVRTVSTALCLSKHYIQNKVYFKTHFTMKHQIRVRFTMENITLSKSSSSIPSLEGLKPKVVLRFAKWKSKHQNMDPPAGASNSLREYSQL